MDILPIAHWRLLYRWYSNLRASVRWNSVTGTPFHVSRGTRQGSLLSPMLFNIFIDQLLRTLRSTNAGVRLGHHHSNSFAYADDISLFSATVPGLQQLIDLCEDFARKWRFTFSRSKSKCTVIGKYNATPSPEWLLGSHTMATVDHVDILGVGFHSNGDTTQYVEERIKSCRRATYGLQSVGMSYPGLNSEAKAHLWRTICCPTLVYGMDTIPMSTYSQKRLDTTQGCTLKHVLGIPKRNHHSQLLEALDIHKVKTIIENRTVALYNRIFKLPSSPTQIYVSMNLRNTYCITRHIKAQS